METELRHIDDVEDTSLVRRLCALVATSQGNGATEHEMEQAMIMAQKLAIKHRVDLATITCADTGMSKQEEMLEGKLRVGESTRRPPANTYICGILQEFFNVEIVYTTAKAAARYYREDCRDQVGAYVHFLGRKSDVEFALYAYSFLQKAFSRAWVQYKRASDAPMSRRASFYYGVFNGLSNRLREERGDAERAALADTGLSEQNYQLTVVSEADARKSFLRDKHPVLRTVRSTQNAYHQGAIAAGDKAGRELQIARALTSESARPKSQAIEDDEEDDEDLTSDEG